MNNDFNRAAFGLPNGQSIQGNQQQQAFLNQAQLGTYSAGQIPQMNQQQIQLAQYMNINAATQQAVTSAEQQVYANQLRQMTAGHGVGRTNDFLAMQQMADRTMHLQPQQPQNYLQTSHYVQPQAMMAGMSGQSQPQVQNQYGMGQTNYRQNQYLYNLQAQQSLYLQQQQQSQFDHQSQARMHSNIPMAMPQTQQSQQVHRQAHAAISSQQPSLTHQNASLLIPQQNNIQQPSPSTVPQVQQQATPNAQKQPKEEATPPTQVEKPTRAYETALKAAERAQALAAENAQIMKNKAEAEQRERQEQARVENEKIQSEMRKKRQDANEFSSAMKERLQAIPEPLHLATCHTLSKVGSYLPLPSECVAASETLPIYQPFPDLAQMTATQPMAEYLAALLNTCMGEISDLELKHKDDEMNDLEVEEMNPLCRAIHDIDSNALNVESDADLLLFDSHFERAVEEELATNNGFQQPANQHNVPSTSRFAASDNQPASADSSESNQHQTSEEQAQLRRQMVSVGKQPRVATTRKKKDMVASLYDSLTVNFDPLSSSRRRRRAEDGSDPTASDDNESVSNKDGKRFGKKQKLENRMPSRSPTPEAVIYQREAEWIERQQKRQEKLRKRQLETETNGELWSNDVMAENDSLVQFSLVMEKILERTEDMDQPSNEEFLAIDRNLLVELRLEAQKLKDYRNMNKVGQDRLVKLLTLLEQSIREVMNEDGTLNLPVNEADDESDDTLKELIYERLCNSANAACISLTIMTSPKMSKQILLEESIERSISLCKEICQAVVFPAFDNSLKNSISGKSKKEDKSKKRKTGGFGDNLSSTVNFLYQRICELMGCFAELARFHTLNETTLHNLCSVGTPVFFIDSISEIQIEGIRLLSTVFATSPEMRRSVLHELLESLHRLPSNKNHRNCFRLSETLWIGNFTVLMLQLIQSVVKVPSKRKNEALDELDDIMQNDITVEDAAVLESYQEAQTLAVMFFSGFLGKCAVKSEDDYRRLFEQFLQDVLAALYRPAWPVAELMLTVLGNLLVKKFRSKTEVSLRIACLEYLGTISARLRRDRVQARKDDKQHLDLVIKTLLSDEQGESIESIDISAMTLSDKIQKVQQALIDYVISKNADDVAVEYTILFYVAEWYRETITDIETAKERHRQNVDGGQYTDNEIRKDERRLQKLLEKGDKMKSAILRLVDKKYLRSRALYIAKSDNVLLDSDATWIVKYLASKREFSQSFEHYLKQITYGVSNETSVGVRTKAMRCLTQIIEADNRVLLFNDVHTAVNGRMTDLNIAVREATAELIGRYVVSRPDFINTYYNVLIQRIVDTGVAVRKRIIRILRDVIEKHPDFEKNPEIIAKIVRRIADEDGVRKLVLDVIYNLWFTPINNAEAFQKRITLMADAINEIIKLGFIDYLKQAISAILKEFAEKPQLEDVCRQLVDALVDNVLQLDQEMANVESVSEAKGSEDDENEELKEAANSKRIVQQRMIACLTALSVFSNVNPTLLIRHSEIFLPYLTIKPASPMELQVLVAIIQMLERIVPLMDHPSDNFLHSLDNRLDELLRSQNTGLTISACVACSGAIYRAFPKFCPKLFVQFAKFLEFLQMTNRSLATTSIEQKTIAMLKKVMYSVGVICRYFDVDVVMQKYAGDEAIGRIRKNFLNDPKTLEEGMVRRQVLEIFGNFCSDKNPNLKLISLSSLGQITAECPDFLLDNTVKRIFVESLKDRRVPILSQTLSNLNMFLVAAEDRAMKSNEKFREQREGDLKEMELGNSGLSSSIMQHYWSHVMHAYFNPSDDVRQEAANVIFQTQSQGLLTPGSAIPVLIAMCTDRVAAIRNRIELLVKEIDTKYSGMVSSKAIAGVRQSFHLQTVIRVDSAEIIRGIRSVEARPKNDLPTMSNDVQSVLNGLYSCIRNNRQQRRGFLGSVLRLFAEHVEKKVSLPEWLFIADNLAHFPYQNLDEPLYVIYTANQIISRSGQDIMSNFRQLQTSQQVEGSEDDEFSPEVIYARMPDNKTQIYELKTETHACYLLMALKTYLMRMYNFKEDKVQEYSPSESAKVYEKPVSRRNVAIFSPQSIFNEFNKNSSVNNTIEDHIKLAHHFSNFFNKLLSLEADEDDAPDDAAKKDDEGEPMEE